MVYAPVSLTTGENGEDAVKRGDPSAFRPLEPRFRPLFEFSPRGGAAVARVARSSYGPGSHGQASSPVSGQATPTCDSSRVNAGSGSLALGETAVSVATGDDPARQFQER